VSARSTRGCVAAALALVAAVYAACLAGLEPGGFWIIDNAHKFLQLEAVLAGGYTDYTIPWPGAALDPTYAWNPLPAPFSRVEDGALHSFYPPFFATLSTLPYRLFGMRGLLLLPFAATLACLAALARLAARLGLGPGGRAGALLLAGLCTPLWFYALVFWEHAPAVCLAVFGLAFLVDFVDAGRMRDLALACALSGLAVWFRDELYLWCAVVATLAWLHAAGRRARVAATALASFAVALLPLWAFQAFALGHPFGFHLAAQNAAAVTEHLAARPLVAYLLFLAFVPSLGASLLLAAPFAIGLVASPRVSEAAFARALPALALVATACCAVSLAGFFGAFGETSPIRWLQQSNGLFSATPVLALACLRPRADDPRRLRAAACIRAAALIYAGLYLLAAPALGSRGIHWGNRLLLVLYPPLALLAAANLARWISAVQPRRRLGLAALCLCVAVSCAAQAFGVTLLARRVEFSQRLQAAVLARPETAIATDVWWAPQDLYAVFYRRPVFLVASRHELDRLLAKLRGAGHERVLWVERRGSAALPGALVERVDDPGLGYFALDFLSIPLAR
jgi:hypothetical protein